nr:immunoglobulin light chain junction region [Macaca mulatta]
DYYCCSYAGAYTSLF